jgi:hypothetical protein
MTKREKTSAEVLEAVSAIIDQIKPHLSGQHPEIQGAVLADLMATWLAGHPPFIRESLLMMHMNMVRELTVANENIMFGKDGHPQQEQPDFDYFECPECGFDCIQPAAFDGDDTCPLCAGDSGHDVQMHRRTAITTDKPEGLDARKMKAAAPDVQ